MNTILVSDVFGTTPALLNLGRELNAVEIIDPYQGVEMNFKNETEAYSYFIKQVGFDSYLAKLLEVTKSTGSAVGLIGFSIGASTIWRLSEKRDISNVKKAVCFYGSQIRNYLSKPVNKIVPQFEIELVFPTSEPHFNVNQLQTKLANIHNVQTRQVNGLHGFMNHYSDNYNQTAYEEQVELLRLKFP